MKKTETKMKLSRPTKAVPTPAPTPTPAKTAPADDAPDYSVIVGLKKTNLPDLARRIRELDDMKKEIEIELKSLKEDGAALLQRYDVKTVMAGGLRVTRVDGTSVSIVRTLLLENGVEPETIEKSTKRTPWTSLKVTAKADGDGE